MNVIFLQQEEIPKLHSQLLPSFISLMKRKNPMEQRNKSLSPPEMHANLHIRIFLQLSRSYLFKVTLVHSNKPPTSSGEVCLFPQTNQDKSFLLCFVPLLVPRKIVLALRKASLPSSIIASSKFQLGRLNRWTTYAVHVDWVGAASPSYFNCTPLLHSYAHVIKWFGWARPISMTNQQI